VASPHDSPAVSSLLRRPRHGRTADGLPPDFSRPHRRRPYRPAEAGTVRCVVGVCPRTYPKPASYRCFRPHTPSSRCGRPALEPIQLEALVPRSRSLPFPERSFTSGEDVSDVTHRREPRLARPSGEGVALESLRPRRLLSCRSRGARARARCRVVFTILHVWSPASLLPAPSRARVATAFPHGLTGALPPRDVTRAKSPAS